MDYSAVSGVGRDLCLATQPFEKFLPETKVSLMHICLLSSHMFSSSSGHLVYNSNSFIGMSRVIA